MKSLLMNEPSFTSLNKTTDDFIVFIGCVVMSNHIFLRLSTMFRYHRTNDSTLPVRMQCDRVKRDHVNDALIFRKTCRMTSYKWYIFQNLWYVYCRSPKISCVMKKKEIKNMLDNIYTDLYTDLYSCRRFSVPNFHCNLP